MPAWPSSAWVAPLPVAPAPWLRGARASAASAAPPPVAARARRPSRLRAQLLEEHEAAAEAAAPAPPDPTATITSTRQQLAARVAPPVPALQSTGDFLAVMAGAAERDHAAFVLFHAAYCRACIAVLPKFRALAADVPSVSFATVKLEDARELAMRLGVHQVPLVHVYDRSNGKVDAFPCGPSSLQRLRDTVLEFAQTKNSQPLSVQTTEGAPDAQSFEDSRR